MFLSAILAKAHKVIALRPKQRLKPHVLAPRRAPAKLIGLRPPPEAIAPIVIAK